MGIGLILGGLGKGISDAGASYGHAMSRAAELEWQDRRDEEKEKRLTMRQEALERLKDSILEERAQKDATKAVEVESRADAIGTQRTAKQLEKESGRLAQNAQQIKGASPAMTQEEMQAHLESLSPSERNAMARTGLIDRAMTRNETRLQSAEDQVQAARELGASSTLLKSYQESKKAVLDAIREENKEKRDEQRHTESMARMDQQAAQFAALLPIRQQTADAATTRAEKTGSGRGNTGDKPATGIDLERSAKAAEKSLAMELGVPVKDVPEKISSLRRQNKITPAIQERLDAYNGALTEWQNYKKNRPSDGDNSTKSGKSDYSNLWK